MCSGRDLWNPLLLHVQKTASKQCDSLVSIIQEVTSPLLFSVQELLTWLCDWVCVRRVNAFAPATGEY